MKNLWVWRGFVLAVGFLFAVTIALANGLDLMSSLKAGSSIVLLVCAVCIPISWSMAIATKKGYPDWLAGILVLGFNILGLVIVILLPIRATLNKLAAAQTRQ